MFAALDIQGSVQSQIQFPVLSTDTRNLRPGSVFVALQGAKHDGHDFLTAAAASGAALAVVQRIPEGSAPLPLLCVNDTLLAFGHMARSKRRHLSAKVIAVVGSNGKTSTRDMLSAILSDFFCVHSTKNNENNLIGVPKTLLEAKQDNDIVIVELGTSKKGEIARAASMAEPDIVVFTSLSDEHLEGLGDSAGVFQEECSVFQYLRPSAKAFIPSHLRNVIRVARLFAEDVHLVPSVAGSAQGAPSQAYIDKRGFARFFFEGNYLSIPYAALAFADNASLALHVAKSLGMSSAQAQSALQGMRPTPLRAELRLVGGFRVLADCYNANPASFRVAIETMEQLQGRRIAFIGTMDELGKQSTVLHQQVAQQIATAGFDRIVAIGKFAEVFAKRPLFSSTPCILAQSVEQGFELLRAQLVGGEAILFKASRRLRLERFIDQLVQSP
ncbi:MAG: UDP-N-acetylmuramoyl-tripeptide--D-alanyl-D-alanine ligase [Myxococcales bacterium]|nr:MAG: UDP-N-acetylmuramoyl-tripeptide--D-alanyl-D-alanine ligase [Myxococcales bacterium]